MLTLRPVCRDDLGAVFDLALRGDQRRFVAPNAVTLAEASFEKGARSFAICKGAEIIGFLASLDFRVNQNLVRGDDRTSIFLWRFMIAEAHQGKGHGRAAMQRFLDWCREQGAQAVTLEVGTTNSVATKLYRSFGFTETGRVFEDEIEFRLAL